jgi:mono/diheme cytochrome c family protein
MRWLLVLLLAGCTSAPPPPPPTTPGAVDGAALYAQNCALCHQADGTGQAGLYPPLAGSEWLKGDPALPVRIVLAGLQGPVTVKGVKFDGQMPSFASVLSDGELAAVLTYVRGEFNGLREPVPAALVTRLRPGRELPWTAAELKKAR